MVRIVALTILSLFFNLASAAVTQPQTKWANHEIPVRVCWGNWNLDFEKFNQKKKDAVLTTKRFDLEKSKLTEFSQETKLLVQTIVNQEFTPQRTIIHFVGWQTCENDPLAVVGIFPAVPIKENGAFTIGSSSVGKNSLYYIKTKKGLIEAPVGKRVWVKKIVMKTDSDLGLSVRTFDTTVVDEIKMRKDGYLPLKGGSTVVHEFGHVAGLVPELATLSRADYR